MQWRMVEGTSDEKIDRLEGLRKDGAEGTKMLGVVVGMVMGIVDSGAGSIEGVVTLRE